MAARHKSRKHTTMSSPAPVEFRLKLPSPNISQSKPRTTTSNRLVAPNIPKSSLSYSTIIVRPATPHCSNSRQQQSTPFLYINNTPGISRRAASARSSISSHTSLPLLPTPHPPHYVHFLAYLRRQSLARLRRKRQEEQTTDHTEASVTFNSHKPTSQSFHSTSNISFQTLRSETLSMPAVPLRMKQKARPLSPYHQFRRSSSLIPTNYRLNLDPSSRLQQSPSLQIPTKQPSDDQLLISPSKSVLITPANSVVDEPTQSSTTEAPYELRLNGNILSYCYISDSGVTYQGQLLSTPV